MDETFAEKSFIYFLDTLVSNEKYAGFVLGLQEKPHDRYYADNNWHQVQKLLEPYTDAKQALHDYAFNSKDRSISFSACNLKACYLIDEDFIDGGRAFVLFNLVATNWFHISIVNNQLKDWKILNQ